MERMFFKSDKVPSHWDTWLYYYEDTYYLYYLAEVDGKKCWAGFGVAVSKDGVSWEDYGLAITASDKMVDYLGTGSVWKSPNFSEDKTFIANYSELHMISETEKVQRIFFATSKDLIHWDKVPGLVFDVDENYYEKLGRWDCIYSMPEEKGGLYGTWTATPKGRGKLSGGIGFGSSVDGFHWTALESMGIFPDVDESGAIEKIGDKYFAMFGKWGSGMLAYSADNINGPYNICSKNQVLIGDKYTYFSRFFKVKDELLVNHHAITRSKSSGNEYLSVCYFAPLKKAMVDAENNIWLYYWKGNDRLKELGNIKTEGFDLKASFFIEGKISTANVINICYGENDNTTTLKFIENALQIDCDNELEVFTRDVVFGNEAYLKLLLKESVFEVYFNDIYMCSFSMPGNFNGKLTIGNTLTVYEINE